MVGKTKRRTAEDQRRFDALKSMGCILSLEKGVGWCPSEIHHIVDGYRKGHQYTIPLNRWYHRGEPMDIDQTVSMAKKLYGPSLALHKREFVAKFGTELEILDRVNALLGEYKNG